MGSSQLADSAPHFGQKFWRGPLPLRLWNVPKSQTSSACERQRGGGGGGGGGEVERGRRGEMEEGEEG